MKIKVLLRNVIISTIAQRALVVLDVMNQKNIPKLKAEFDVIDWNISIFFNTTLKSVFLKKTKKSGGIISNNCSTWSELIWLCVQDWLGVNHSNSQYIEAWVV